MYRYDTQVGYCQGLPFVAAVLLLHVSAFDTLVLNILNSQIDARRGGVLFAYQAYVFLRSQRAFPTRDAQITATASESALAPEDFLY